MGEYVVQTAGLTKVFRDFWLREKVTAVADLNLEVPPRQVFGLLGPNGSGKSTTLKMILGLLFPTKGSIAVFGKEPTNVRVKANIGFLPEESHLYPFLDARETLGWTRWARGSSKTSSARLGSVARRSFSQAISWRMSKMCATGSAFSMAGVAGRTGRPATCWSRKISRKSQLKIWTLRRSKKFDA